jgi:hypothetical protein
MTLKLTLQNIAKIDPAQARVTTIFYFTYNYATYCIALLYCRDGLVA